jgi:hypothetical protein
VQSAPGRDGRARNLQQTVDGEHGGRLAIVEDEPQ